MSVIGPSGGIRTTDTPDRARSSFAQASVSIASDFPRWNVVTPSRCGV